MASSNSFSSFDLPWGEKQYKMIHLLQGKEKTSQSILSFITRDDIHSYLSLSNSSYRGKCASNQSSLHSIINIFPFLVYNISLLPFSYL